MKSAFRLLIFLNTRVFLITCIVAPTNLILPKRYTNKSIVGVACNFISRTSSYNTDYKHILTIIVSPDTRFEYLQIQDEILKNLHKLAVWPIEILTYRFNTDGNGSLVDNTNVLLSITEDVKQENVYITVKTPFYLILTDSLSDFEEKFEILHSTGSLNIDATFLVCFIALRPEYATIAKTIVKKMSDQRVLKAFTLIPRNRTVFKLYKLKINTQGPELCHGIETMVEIGEYIEGQLYTERRSIFDNFANFKYNGCSINIVSMPYKPNVISNMSGFEIDIVKEVGTALNVNFHIFTFTDSGNWGDFENDTWWGPASDMYYNLYIGVGNIVPDTYYIPEFTYSVAYYMTELNWVVPAAGFVPKWRILAAIFDKEIWAACIGIIIGYAYVFYVSARYFHERETYKSFGNCLLKAFQVVIGNAVPKQPNSDVTRLFFVTLAVFSIILGSIYTCSLVYYLTYHIREHQLESTEDILNSDLEIGGLQLYKQYFKTSRGDDEMSYRVFEKYKTAEYTHDNMHHWLRKVGISRTHAIIASKLYVRYLIFERNSTVVDSGRISRVHVVEKPVINGFVAMMLRKGHPITSKLNGVINSLSEAGIVMYLIRKYKRSIDRDKQLNIYDSNFVMPLTPYHMEGAFSMILLGYLLSCLVLIFEVLYHKLSIFLVRRNINKENKRDLWKTNHQKIKGFNK